MAAAPSREGDVLKGKYKLEKLLGAGGMGEVYKALNLGIGRTVAIKVLRPEFANNGDVVERFLREARAANAVHHRNVVEMLDIDSDDKGVPFIVQEYLQGEDFSAMLERFPDGAPPGIALSVLTPIVNAVAAAHAKGIVHRDLKPENVFLAREDGGVTVPKVLDFGISKLPETAGSVRLTQTHAIMGSPAYMSPEQIMTPQDVDARSDIWSLGVILFECLSGQLPFMGGTAEALFVKICRDEPLKLEDVAPHLPEDFSRMVDKCLQREPGLRYANGMELAEEFKAIRRRLKVPEFDLGTSAGSGERVPVKPATVHGQDAVNARAPAAAAAFGPTVMAQPAPSVAAVPPTAAPVAAPAMTKPGHAPHAFAATVAAVPAPVQSVQATVGGVGPRAVMPVPAAPVAPTAQGFAQVTDADRVVEVLSPKAPAAATMPQGAAAPRVVSELNSAVFGKDKKARSPANTLSEMRKRESVAQPVPRASLSEAQAAARQGRASATSTTSSAVVTASRSDAAFDLGGMIDGFQAAILVVGITLMVPLLTEQGMPKAVAALGTNLPYAAYVVAVVLGAAAGRVGLMGMGQNSLALHAAGAGLLALAGAVFVAGVSLQDPGSGMASLQEHVPQVAPWAVIAVCLGLASYGLRRAYEELWSGGRPRTAYGAFVLVMALGGLLAGYKIVRHVALPSVSAESPTAAPQSGLGSNGQDPDT